MTAAYPDGLPVRFCSVSLERGDGRFLCRAANAWGMEVGGGKRSVGSGSAIAISEYGQGDRNKQGCSCRGLKGKPDQILPGRGRGMKARGAVEKIW